VLVNYNKRRQIVNMYPVACQAYFNPVRAAFPPGGVKPRQGGGVKKNACQNRYNMVVISTFKESEECICQRCVMSVERADRLATT